LKAHQKELKKLVKKWLQSRKKSKISKMKKCGKIGKRPARGVETEGRGVDILINFLAIKYRHGGMNL
jgi:hypothetical protein